MFKNFPKLLKYEILNIARNRWIFGYTLFIFALTFVLIKIAGDFTKASVSLGLLSIVLVPLMTAIFTSLHWYYSDRFTQLLLTQPMSRSSLYLSRFVALNLTLSLSYALGIFFGFLSFGHMGFSVFILIALATLLAFVFISLSFYLSIQINDRMRGVGLVFAVWIYFALVHDGLLLLALLFLKDSPMDIPGGFLGAFSPIGLSRVMLLMQFNAPLLLGHTGALVRNILTSWQGYVLAGGISLAWMLVPTVLGYWAFKKKDF